jgi:rhodanese-related sulfurtransferase
MKPILLLLFAFPVLSEAQFKNDNTLYKTIYWQQFCNQYPQEKDALLLDVRSTGEYSDTSSSSGLNIGHLNGATHINISELGNRLPEIQAYKNKPVYLYCSHSQRSRRGSKLLSDSGFTNVININGGLTDLYLTDASTVPCKTSLLQTNNAWKQYNPLQVYELIKKYPGSYDSLM